VNLDSAAIARLADLAQLEIDAAEIARLSEDLTRILDYFAVLDASDPGGSLPGPGGGGRSARLRPDEAAPTTPRSAALAPAPETENGEFSVPAFVRRDQTTSQEEPQE
jgi:aspartyl-tRNA(Asn)/glutamyl-tRNA(Gln) amidotransferase subunit C